MMKISVKNTAVLALVLIGMTACSQKPTITYGGRDGKGTPSPAPSAVTETSSVTSVTTDVSETTAQTEPMKEEITDPRRYFDSVKICGEELPLPIVLDELPDGFSYKLAKQDTDGSETYRLYYDDNEAGTIYLNADGSVHSIHFYGDADYEIGDVRQNDDPAAIRKLLGQPEQKSDGMMTYRYDDMRVTFMYHYTGSSISEEAYQVVLVYGDYSDKSDRFILDTDILDDVKGEAAFEYSEICDSIIIDGIQLPTFPFSAKSLPSQFKVAEYAGGSSLMYKDERIADIEVIRGSVVYLGFYAEAMEKYGISVNGLTYDTPENEVRAVLGTPNSLRSTETKLIYVLDNDKVVVVDLGGYKNTYSPEPEETDSNYISIGVTGRKKFGT